MFIVPIGFWKISIELELENLSSFDACRLSRILIILNQNIHPVPKNINPVELWMLTGRSKRQRKRHCVRNSEHRKVLSEKIPRLQKKINFEVQNLTNIHVFRFAFSDLYCYHTDLQNARNAVSDNLIFKISRGGHAPGPPSKERLRRSLVRIINWSHPPVKNPGYGPGVSLAKLTFDFKIKLINQPFTWRLQTWL